MKVLVTGAAGFIGYHLCKKLLEDNHIVVGLDNLNEYYEVSLKKDRLKNLGINHNINDKRMIKSNQYDGFTFIKLSLENQSEIFDLFKIEQFDAVCNLAAQAGVRYSITNPSEYIQSNIIGFYNILEACRNHNVNNLAFASSSSVYGLNKKMPYSTDDNVDLPISLYAATKKSNELMAHTYSHLYGIKTTGLRFFTVYGPWGRPDMAYFKFTKAALNNSTIDVYNNGEMKRDFTYIDDIIEGVVKVIYNPANPSLNSDSAAPFKIYNIGNSNPINLMDFIKAIETKLGKKITKRFLSLQDGDVLNTYADVTQLEKDFNYKPNTDLEDGINKFVDWYKEYYK